MNAQMKKGVIEMCILHYIAIEDLYGYDVMRLMGADFPTVRTSTFYAILKRLHTEGALERYTGDTSDGPDRKYYRITPKGQALLDASVKDWNDLSAAVHRILKASDSKASDSKD